MIHSSKALVTQMLFAYLSYYFPLQTLLSIQLDYPKLQVINKLSFLLQDIPAISFKLILTRPH